MSKCDTNDVTATRISHPLEPVFDERSRVLILGTMPSPKSRETGFYYGHSQNRFWRVLAQLLDEPVPAFNERKADFLLRHGIALWDVLASCDIDGASDASIRNAVPNDLSRIFDAADIQAVFCTGATAAKLYRKHCEPVTGVPCVQLPSTSPANAACKMPALLEAYEAILPHLECLPSAGGGLPAPRTLDVPEVVALEQRIAASGTSMEDLMDRAGLYLAHVVKKYLSPVNPNAVILCGSGNNGGDGWVCALELANLCGKVTVVTPKAPEELSAEPARTTAAKIARLLEALSHVQVLASPEPEQLRRALADGCGVIVDAILGTGFNGSEMREPYATWIRLANECGAPIVAADVPSGMSAQTGVAANPCIRAAATVTMMASKPGLEAPDAVRLTGVVKVAPLIDLRPFFDM